MTNPIYTGPLKDHLQNYVDLKRAIGYKFNEEASCLKRFDRFILEKYPEMSISPPDYAGDLSHDLYVWTEVIRGKASQGR